ncbi:hypothetical protein N7U66_09720 [Lacinutrix neustonica]|uniref:Uncharacterized protein n=1 Tax=Lacinutrix neustonica TaxID=2980107 RepID=A0A9E8N0N5_9FLAO|nr:hypothetical protein [Lacinutrix neustonica]WAC03690.1 hypothetical protein N7U66_09720 [Lacinutrix neustonica]
MKTIFSKLLLLVAVCIVSSCAEETTNDFKEIEQQTIDQSQPLTIAEINAEIESQLNRGQEFDWENESDHFLWSAVIHGNNILTVGYGSENESYSENRSAALETKKDNILKIVETHENYIRGKETVVEHEIINVIDVRVENIKTIETLRKAKNVRYLEPNGYNHYGTDNVMRSDSRL